VPRRPLLSHGNRVAPLPIGFLLPGLHPHAHPLPVRHPLLRRRKGQLHRTPFPPLLTLPLRVQQAPAACNIGEYGPLPQQESCLPCRAVAIIGATVCPGRRRALIAADGSDDAAAGDVDSLGMGGKVDVNGMAAAAGYAGCTLGMLVLMGMAVRRTKVMQSPADAAAVLQTLPRPSEA
jgi:hypothetical protein